MTSNPSTQNQSIAKQDSFQARQSNSPSSPVKGSYPPSNAASQGRDVQCQSIKLPTPWGGFEFTCLPLWANLSVLGVLLIALPLVYWLSFSRKREQSSDASRQPKWLFITLSLSVMFLAGWVGHQALSLLSSKANFPPQSHNTNSPSPAINESTSNPKSTPTPPSTLFARPSETEASINLTWRDAKLDEDGYRIERKTLQGAGDSDYEEIAVLPASQNTFIDRSVIPGLGYTYRLNSFNFNGSSLSPTARARGNNPFGPSTASDRVNPEKVKALLEDIDRFDRERFSERMYNSQEARIIFLVIELAITMTLTLLAIIATISLDHLSDSPNSFGLKAKPRTYLILLLGVGAVTTQVVSSAYAGFMISASLKTGANAEAKSELSILRSKAIDISTNKEYTMIRESFNRLSRSGKNVAL